MSAYTHEIVRCVLQLGRAWWLCCVLCSVCCCGRSAEHTMCTRVTSVSVQWQLTWLLKELFQLLQYVKPPPGATQ